MHLLETNASTNPLQWFMDSPKVQKSDKNLEMIQASAHIEASLPSPVCERLPSGLKFSTPTSSMFPELPAPFYGGDRTDLCTRYKSIDSILQNFPSTVPKIPPSNTHEKSPPKKFTKGHRPSPDTDRSPTRKIKYNSSFQTQQGIISARGNLNGVIKGFIVNTKQRDDDNAEDDDITTKSDNEMKSPSRNLYKIKAVEKDRDDQPISCGDYSGQDFSNTQNILTKMYASFGANALRNEELLLHPVKPKGQEATTMNIEPHTPRAEENAAESARKTAENVGFRKEISSTDLPIRPTEDLIGKERAERKRRKGREDGMQLYSGHANKRRVLNEEPKQGSSSHPYKHISDHATNQTEGRRQGSNSTRVQAENSKYNPRIYSPVRNEYPTSPTWVSTPEKSYGNHTGSAKSKDSSSSPRHSIDSLLCREQRYSSPTRRSSNEEQIYASSPYRHIPPQHTSPLPHSETPSSLNSQSPQPRPSSKGRVDRMRQGEENDDKLPAFQNDNYNDRAREVFQREKEIIENSLRQNGQVPLGASHSPYLQNPYMMNPGALAALQSSLLSSIHPGPAVLPDPAMALKTASLAAAASANPLLLGFNQYFSNPFLLRSLIGNGLQGMAYGQAMSQSIMPHHSSIIPLLSAMPGNPPIPQAMNPLLYGGLPDSHINAAIASTSYPQGVFPYLPPHLSPSLLENQGKAAEMNKARGEVDPKKLRTEEIRPILMDSKTNMNKNLSGTGRPLPVCKEEKFAQIGNAKKEEPRRGSPDLLRNRCKLSSETIDRNTILPQISGTSVSRSSNNNKMKRKQASSLPNSLPKKVARAQGEKMDRTYTKRATDGLSPSKILEALKHKKEKETVNRAEKNEATFDKTSRPASYKNLTRERRLVANARERTRVHTISSAFEDLRQNIPSYSCNQKLSKLAILRIACSYIRSLSVLAGRNTEDTFSESVEQCTRVLQAESRARSRRKSNKAQIEWEVAHYEKGAGYGNESGDTRTRSVSTTHSRPRVAASNSPPHESREQVCEEDSSQDSSKFPRDADFTEQTTIHPSPDSFNDRSGILSANTAESDGSRLNAFVGFINHSSENAKKKIEMVRFQSDDASDTWHKDEAARTNHSLTCDNLKKCSSSPAGDHKDTFENDEVGSPEDLQNDLINVED